MKQFDFSRWREKSKREYVDMCRDEGRRRAIRYCKKLAYLKGAQSLEYVAMGDARIAGNLAKIAASYARKVLQ